MIRTSINLPAQLHHQLQVVAFGHNQTMSDVVRRLLARSLAQQKDARMKRVYASLASVKGIGQDDVTQVATTMNTLLYGPEGAWKGRDA